jgi:hypothetical protein
MLRAENTDMSQNLYDQGSRYLVGLDAMGFFRWLLGLQSSEFAFRGWLDTRAISYPGERDLTSDLIAHLENLLEHGVPWALMLEFQIVPGPEMFGRILRHLGSIWQYVWPDAERGSRFFVGAAIINLTGRGRCAQEMRWPAARLTTHLGVVERNLEYERADDLLRGMESGQWPLTLLPFVPLMIGGDHTDIMDRWTILAQGEPDTRRRADYAAIALLFAERAGIKSNWDEKLQGWNVTESAYINQFITQGEAKGRAEGEAKGRLVTLLEVLTEKFQSLPSDLETAIRGTTDIDRLKSWTTSAVKAKTLEEFRTSSGL